MPNMTETYAAWRKTSEEMLADMPGSIDCGEASVRKDFSEWAGLPETISFEEMHGLEKAYDNK